LIKITKQINYMNEFIDHRNSDLWNMLNDKFEITIEKSLNQEYSCYTINNTAIIRVDYNNVSVDSFTHELLHIYLKNKEFYLGASIKLTLKQSKILQRLLTDDLLEHIGNSLDHLKMFEIYKSMDCRKEEFLLDYNMYKFSEQDSVVLKKQYRLRNKINPVCVDFYIGKLIALLCDPNDSNDYTEALKEFEKQDPDLYKTVNNLVEETRNYDIDSNDIFNSYRDIANNFYSRLIKWINKNKIS
jgi:hypothetical protein